MDVIALLPPVASASALFAFGSPGPGFDSIVRVRLPGRGEPPALGVCGVLGFLLRHSRIPHRRLRDGLADAAPTTGGDALPSRGGRPDGRLRRQPAGNEARIGAIIEAVSCWLV